MIFVLVVAVEQAGTLVRGRIIKDRIARRPGMKTDTAHRAWDVKWGTEQGRADWIAAEPDVMETAGELAAKYGQLRALDLGCGVGRHALLFARLGFDVSAVDLAEAGLAEVRRGAEAEGLTIDARAAP